MMDSSNSYASTTSKRSTMKPFGNDIQEENDYLRATIEKLTIQLNNMKVESQKKGNQVAELQKWVKNLTEVNSANYATAMAKINEGLEYYFYLKQDICELKKQTMHEKRRYMDLSDKYNKAKEESNRLRREMMNTPEGMLVIEKTNLENSLKQISEEVEVLSEKNERLLADLKQKDFLKAYEEATNELSKLREEFNEFLKETKIKPKSPRRESTNFTKLFNLSCQSAQKK